MSKKTFRNTAISTLAASAAVAAVAPAAVSADDGFPDVTQNNDHYDNIMKLAEQGVIKGDQDGNFNPLNRVGRGQIASMFANALDLDTPENVNKVLDQYDDVDGNREHANAIAAVTQAGIFQGHDGEFGIYEPITREQMATVLVKAFDLDKYDLDSNVELNTDNIGPSHKDSVQVLANLGITNQFDDFRPHEFISRGQFSTFLVETQNVIETNDQEDTEAPNITVDSDSTVNVNHGADFTVPEASAEDNRDGSVDVTTQITDSDGNNVDAIDTSKAGSYIVTYTAEDEAGNKTATAITVNVMAKDTEAPEISVHGNNTINVDYGADFMIPEAVAEDNRGGPVDVTTQITDSDGNNVDAIDTSESGSYIVTYTAEDEAGNKTATAITVHVMEEDTEAPDINIDSDNTVNVEHGADFSLPKATAEDNRDGSVEVTTQITDQDGNNVDEIDTSESGSYIVTYTAEDEAGNTAAKAITVNVSEFTNKEAVQNQAESITSDDVTVEQDDAQLDLDKLVDDGYTATVASTSATDVINTNDEVVLPKNDETVNVTFLVSKDGTNAKAYSDELSIEVPAES